MLQCTIRVRRRAGCTIAKRALSAARRSTEQLGDVDDLLRDVEQSRVAVHRELAQKPVRLFVADTLLLHQEALGALDHFALGKLRLRVAELVTQRLLALETRERNLEN